MTAKEKIEKLRGLLGEVQEISQDLMDSDEVVLTFTVGSEKKTVEVTAETTFEIKVLGVINQAI